MKTPKKPGPKHDQRPVWFVWVKKTHSHYGKPYIDLRAVCTNEALAELYRDMVIRDEDDAEDIFIEERITDHLYAQREVGMVLRLGSVDGRIRRWQRE